MKPTSKNQVFDWISGQESFHKRLSRFLKGLKTSEKSEGIVWYSDTEFIISMYLKNYHSIYNGVQGCREKCENDSVHIDYIMVVIMRLR